MSNDAGMHPALQRRIREREHLLDIARGYARRLAERVPPRWVVVAGSVARGDFHDGSDVDVLVVSDALPPQPLRRAEILFAVAEGGVEPKGLTSEEARREAERRNPLVLEALTRGVVVYPEGLSLQEVRAELGIDHADDPR
ncbi:MAG: nucleotidyltransferase domain-containing protein [Bacteroidota bacterium]